MNSVGVQAQVNEANVRKDRIKSVGKSKFQKIIDLFK
jgi:hypothetical protein